MKKKTTFTISKKPGPMALVVETTPFTITSSGSGTKAESLVDYEDSIVNIYLAFRGQQGQEFEMKMKLNGIDKDIKGNLYTNGVNRFTPSYNLSEFGLSVASTLVS